MMEFEEFAKKVLKVDLEDWQKGLAKDIKEMGVAQLNKPNTYTNYVNYITDQLTKTQDVLQVAVDGLEAIASKSNCLCHAPYYLCSYCRAKEILAKINAILGGGVMAKEIVTKELLEHAERYGELQSQYFHQAENLKALEAQNKVLIEGLERLYRYAHTYEEIVMDKEGDWVSFMEIEHILAKATTKGGGK